MHSSIVRSIVRPCDGAGETDDGDVDEDSDEDDDKTGSDGVGTEGTRCRSIELAETERRNGLRRSSLGSQLW